MCTLFDDFSNILNLELNKNHPEEETSKTSLKSISLQNLYEKPAKTLRREIHEGDTLLEEITIDDIDRMRRNIYRSKRIELLPLVKTQNEVLN